MSMRTRLILLTLIVLSSVSGCHCFRCSEHYWDGVDEVADKWDFKKKLDDCYCERLDISRSCMNRRCPPSRCPHCR